ncbi:hypothetical protein RUM43_009717 [Polyplax serrata]|uniref:Peptidase S1 domain-containing protein n=1 Tax=Polyplax serrata TaxID=468196 RepID=A0AAN8P789_POLSC
MYTSIQDCCRKYNKAEDLGFDISKVTSRVVELIIGGQPIEIQQVPYQAGLYIGNMFFCSGSIVTTTHIITAAHCLAFVYVTKTSRPGSYTKYLNVRVGSSNMYVGGQSITVRNYSIHQKFSRVTVDYDVGVITLKTPLNFTSLIQPLKLAEKEPKHGQEVRVSGWGYVKEIGPTSRKLQSVTVKLVGRETCENNYRGRFQVTDRMICASAEDKDACYGDSGGPLVHKGKLLGIVSSGEGCARKNFPGIYTSVANKEIKEFILKETGLKNKCKFPGLC